MTLSNTKQNRIFKIRNIIFKRLKNTNIIKIQHRIRLKIRNIINYETKLITKNNYEAQLIKNKMTCNINNINTKNMARYETTQHDILTIRHLKTFFDTKHF